MVRSLVIRQVFRLCDMALAIAVVAVVVVVVKMFLTPLAPLDAEVSGEPDASVELASVLKSVGERNAYDSLIKSGLFGSASDWDPKSAPSEEAAIEGEDGADIQDSELGLVLRGTVALDAGDAFAAALIENTEKRDKARPYKLGQEVMENITVDDIEQREVILLNKRQDPPRKERLRMSDLRLQQAGGGVPGDSTPAPGRQGGEQGTEKPQLAGRQSLVQRVTVNREEIIQEAMQNYSSLVSITPEVKKDESGKVIGLSAENIEEQPLAKKLGFKNGDVLQTFNNEEVDSRERLMEVFQRYQNSGSFRIGILRDGKPTVLNFQLE